MSDESFKIVIKSINQVFPDETIECQRDWTFRQLKIHVSQLKSDEKFVQNRQIHSQRLIRDDEILKNVFKQYSEDSPPVLYIVPPVPSPSSSSTPTLRKRNTTTTTTPTTNPPTNQISTQQFSFNNFPPTFDISAYSPYLIQGSNLPGMLGYGFNLAPPPLSSSPQQPYTPQQQQFSMLHHQQQLYYSQLNHFLMHYYRHQQHQGTNVQPATAPQPQQANPPPAQQPPQEQANNLNNGAFLMEDDDDGRRRDWLDWSYVMLRFVMLMCILYFYSTPARFFTFISISVLLVILQMGWVHRLFIERFLGILPQPNQGQQPAAEQPQQPANNEEQQQQQEANNAQQNNQNNQQAQAPEPPRNAFSILCSFIIGFFTSLAPQIPPPVNNN